MSQKYEICLRLDEKEKERLETDAKRCGLTRNAYLRRLIKGGEIRERSKEEIKLLRTEIHQIENNINQFTRMANAFCKNTQNILYNISKNYTYRRLFFVENVFTFSATHATI